MEQTSIGKKSFILYDDYFDHISLLNNPEKGWVFDSIFKYRLGIELDEAPSAAAQMALSFIGKQMDRDCEKYEQFIDKQRKNGAKGGRPKKPTESQKSLTDTVTVTVTDTDNDIKKINNKKTGVGSNLNALDNHLQDIGFK